MPLRPTEFDLLVLLFWRSVVLELSLRANQSALQGWRFRLFSFDLRGDE
jgi:hypothetical protein